MEIKTMKVMPWGEGQGDHVLINEADFDPKVHKAFKEVKEKVSAATPAPTPAPTAAPAAAADASATTTETVKAAAKKTTKAKRTK